MRSNRSRPVASMAAIPLMLIARQRALADITASHRSVASPLLTSFGCCARTGYWTGPLLDQVMGPSALASALARRNIHYGWVIVGVTLITTVVTAAAMST